MNKKITHEKILFPVLILAIVLGMGDCKTENENNEYSLIGKWEDTWKNEEGDLYKEMYIFTENEFTYSYEGFTNKEVNYQTTKEPFNRIDRGTCQINDSTITFLFKEINGEDVTQSNLSGTAGFIVTKNELKLTVRGDVSIYKRIN